MEPEEASAPAASPRSAGRLLVLLGFAVAALAGFFLYRRIAGAPAAPAAKAAGPPAGALVATIPVALSPKAAIIADRFNCLCGECSDTLGACTCTRDAGSSEMKATLEKLVAEKKTLSEVEAAMVAKYGPKVLATSGAPPAKPSDKTPGQ